MSDVDLKLQFLCNKLIITHKYFVGILQLYPEVYGLLLLKVLGPIRITVYFFAVRLKKRMSNSTLAMLNLFMRQQILLILISWYVERSSTYKLTSFFLINNIFQSQCRISSVHLEYFNGQEQFLFGDTMLRKFTLILDKDNDRIGFSNVQAS